MTAVVRKILDKAHRLGAKHVWVVNIAVLLRNQCNSIIAAYLCVSCKMESNGEQVFLRTAIGDGKPVVLDVGANHGDYAAAVLLVNAGAAVHCFEPTPDLASALRARFANKSVYIHEIALSDSVGRAKFYVSNKDQLSSLVVHDDVSLEVDVAVETLDSYCQSQSISYIDLLKIDVEGNDSKVLLGARSLLSDNKVAAIQFEYNGPWAIAGSTLSFTVQFLEGLGYLVFRITPSGLKPVEIDKWGEYFRYSNYAAIRRDLVEKVHAAWGALR